MSADHAEQSFWQKYVFSTDHKTIGLQYGFAALLFMLFGFTLMILMRWQLAFPGKELPILGHLISKVLGHTTMPGGVMTSEFYNALGAMHGTIMVFLGVVPLGVSAFGNYFVPLQIGAVDMAFPKLNMASFWVFATGGVIMLASFFVPGGAAHSGWTSYPPLSEFATQGQTWWILGMVCLITSSLLGSINFIVTIIQLRTEGMTWLRMPFFIWAQLVTAFLLLLAFPPLEAAGVLQLVDRLFDTSFFLPTGLVINGEPVIRSGGGSPLLYQHLFWFLGHPEVYVLILPAFGIVTEVFANNIRKPIYGYHLMVKASVMMGFMSMVVWAHHMYVTGMGPFMSSFFQITTMIVSIPSVILLTCLLLSLWGGAIRFNTQMLFALAFLPMFGIGGLTGLPLGLQSTDLFFHDSYYVIGHFHYVVAPGSIFALMAGIYYWFPKMSGKILNNFLGKVHFWGTLVCMNVIFAPMMLQGLAGVPRRMSDGGVAYQFGETVLQWNVVMSYGAFTMLFFQLFFIYNVYNTLKNGKKIEDDNPWQATTLEWAAPNVPPHGNFVEQPHAFRGPYEYSVPGAKTDFSLQFEKSE